MDRDPLFTATFKSILGSIDCEAEILPARSPNLNAYIERFIGTVRREISSAIIPFSVDGLEHMLKQHVAYYNSERPHQALPDHRKPLPNPHDDFSKGEGRITCSSRLGKTLNFYYREAA